MIKLIEGGFKKFIYCDKCKGKKYDECCPACKKLFDEELAEEARLVFFGLL